MAEWYYGDIIATVKIIQEMKKDIAEIKQLLQDRDKIKTNGIKMDKKIAKLSKIAEKEVKGLKSLKKADVKRDKIVDKAKKMVKKGC